MNSDAAYRFEMSDDDYPFDPEQPVEATPGYLGHIFDDYISFGSELAALSDFDWQGYANMASEIACDRCLSLDLGNTKFLVRADAYMINEFLDQLPSVEAIYDCPPNQGPGSGSGYVFVIAEHCPAPEKISQEAAALRKALEIDYETLRSEFVSDPEIQKWYSDRGLDLPQPRYK